MNGNSHHRFWVLKKCRNCFRISGEFITCRYVMVILLSAGGGSIENLGLRTSHLPTEAAKSRTCWRSRHNRPESVESVGCSEWL